MNQNTRLVEYKYYAKHETNTYWEIPPGPPGAYHFTRSFQKFQILWQCIWTFLLSYNFMLIAVMLLSVIISCWLLINRKTKLQNIRVEHFVWKSVLNTIILNFTVWTKKLYPGKLKIWFPQNTSPAMTESVIVTFIISFS